MRRPPRLPERSRKARWRPTPACFPRSPGTSTRARTRQHFEPPASPALASMVLRLCPAAVPAASAAQRQLLLPGPPSVVRSRRRRRQQPTSPLLPLQQPDSSSNRPSRKETRGSTSWRTTDGATSESSWAPPPPPPTTARRRQTAVVILEPPRLRLVLLPAKIPMSGSTASTESLGGLALHVVTSSTRLHHLLKCRLKHRR